MTCPQAGGTLFVNRASIASANGVAARMTERLTHAVPALLFPEGTSTDGSEVLRFHPRLIQPAVQLGAVVTAIAIRYELGDDLGRKLPEHELCWYGDQAFLTHFWRVLAAPRFSAILQFGEPRNYSDCREAAELTRAEIVAMRSGAKSIGIMAMV